MTKSIAKATKKGTRLEQLMVLSVVLSNAIETCENPAALASLAKQYRETIKEIEEIKGVNDTDDEIGEILAGREADGKPGAVRKART